jgi:dolichyl-phosphate-mannose--protein O-mannosyl transferase
MHERHLLPVFAPLSIISALNPSLWLVYIGYSFTYLLNLRYSYDYVTKTVGSYKHLIPVVIFINLVLFGVLLFKIIKGKTKVGTGLKDFYNYLKKHSYQNKNFKLTIKKTRIILLAIVAFSLFTRLIFLNSPQNEYFDEVYHAFTARAMLHDDPKAWEWWNNAPEGFAYEWTHPPLAKEGMVLGMRIFGENSFGWRFPGAILGTLSIFLVFLITRELFNDNFLAILASGTLSLEGLFLVMSRIGMNDMYMLFFALLSFYFYLKKRNFWSAFAFGLSIASKWSAVWLVPIIFVTHFVFKRKVQKSYIWFLIIPPLIYLASYIPMFLTGHSFGEFVEVQKQMWWYHTRLKATHPYESAWWSWPFLIRPVWFYTSGLKNGAIANIYAFGNPIIFWSGLLSGAMCAIFSYYEKNKKLGLIVFSYVMFFIPWALSPRIMFLYHYLPSIPFMAILIAYILKRYQNLIIPFFAISFITFLYFAPHFIGIKIPQGLDLSYYWFPSWR